MLLRLIEIPGSIPVSYFHQCVGIDCCMIYAEDKAVKTGSKADIGLAWGESNEASADDAAFFLGQDAARERAADLANVSSPFSTHTLISINYRMFNHNDECQDFVWKNKYNMLTSLG